MGDCGLAKMRVLLADDHRLMLEAVRVSLEQDGDFEIVAATTDATKVLPLMAEAQPDVVVLDVRMPQLDGITCLKRIRGAHPDVVVVMLSASEDAVDHPAGDGGRGRERSCSSTSIRVTSAR